MEKPSATQTKNRRNALELRLEHQVLSSLGPDLKGRWLVAVSGGLDSMVMAEILWRWQKKLKAEFIIAHIHHGLDENQEFRDRAQALVKRWCAAHALPCLTVRRVRGVLNRKPSLEISAGPS